MDVDDKSNKEDEDDVLEDSIEDNDFELGTKTFCVCVASVISKLLYFSSKLILKYYKTRRERSKLSFVG